MIRTALEALYRRYFLLMALLLLTTGCAIRKPIQAMYCDRMELITTPALPNVLPSQPWPQGTGADQWMCSDPKATLNVDATGTYYCTAIGKYCAAWAKHQTECVHDVYGDCTAETR